MNIKQMSNSVDPQKVLEQQLIGETTHKVVTSINEFILYERNISVFYNLVIQKIINSFNNSLLKVSPELYFRIIFCICKNQNIKLEELK